MYFSDLMIDIYKESRGALSDITGRNRGYWYRINLIFMGIRIQVFY